MTFVLWTIAAGVWLHLLLSVFSELGMRAEIERMRDEELRLR